MQECFTATVVRGLLGSGRCIQAFHNFQMVKEEQHLMGCIHPVMGKEHILAGLPMRMANLPMVACRLSCIVPGKVKENTWWMTHIMNSGHVKGLGHEQVLMGSDGKPAAMIFGMVDDFPVHVNRKEKCRWAFSKFMDMTVQLGFICQKVKNQSTSSSTKVLWNAMIPRRYHKCDYQTQS
jgi:hypothetical protein